MAIAILPPIKTLGQDFTIGLVLKKVPIPPNANNDNWQSHCSHIHNQSHLIICYNATVKIDTMIPNENEITKATTVWNEFGSCSSLSFSCSWFCPHVVLSIFIWSCSMSNWEYIETNSRTSCKHRQTQNSQMNWHQLTMSNSLHSW